MSIGLYQRKLNIAFKRKHGNSLREIASHIKKSYSTISRELSRNSTGKSYSPSKA
ncbi:helix-turn-helix domain-containing protein (plasmid) [Lentilactobacillus buchneri]